MGDITIHTDNWSWEQWGGSRDRCSLNVCVITDQFYVEMTASEETVQERLDVARARSLAKFLNEMCDQIEHLTPRPAR